MIMFETKNRCEILFPIPNVVDSSNRDGLELHLICTRVRVWNKLCSSISPDLTLIALSACCSYPLSSSSPLYNVSIKLYHSLSVSRC